MVWGKARRCPLVYLFRGPLPHRQQAGYSATELRSPKNNISVITVGNPANPKAGNNSDYVPASADNSITGIQRTAEDNFTGAWISMRPRNVAFNYIVRAA